MFTKLSISSPAFGNNQAIPREYTADGANVSPPLEWRDEPSQTKSFVLIVDDPDAPDPRAPARTWVHWVLYNIPAGTHVLPADAVVAGFVLESSACLEERQVCGRQRQPAVAVRTRVFPLSA